jgi:hypothetical protein
LVVKAAVSGVVIVTGTVIANRLSPSLGGWVAAFPTIGFLTVSWLWFDGGSGSEATGLFVGGAVGHAPHGGADRVRRGDAQERVAAGGLDVPGKLRLDHLHAGGAEGRPVRDVGTTQASLQE